MVAHLQLKSNPDISDPCYRLDKKAQLLECLAIRGEWQ